MKTPDTVRLAWRLLSRDWRAGELRVLIAALVLAVASVGTVGFFTDRVKGALTRQANLLLGADLLLSGDRPLPDEFMREARLRGLAAVPAIKFNSMVQRVGASAGAEGTGAVLADVKEAVRLVERAFVLHARYTDLFRLTPMVTVLADRLYQQPSFVRTAALDP